MIDKLYLNYFPHSKMAISEHKNGHFEEIREWLQILELGSNSTIFHLLFDTYDSPGAVFIWKWEKYRPYLLVCSLLVLTSCQISKTSSHISKSQKFKLSEEKSYVFRFLFQNFRLPYASPRWHSVDFDLSVSSIFYSRLK